LTKKIITTTYIINHFNILLFCFQYFSKEVNSFLDFLIFDIIMTFCKKFLDSSDSMFWRHKLRLLSYLKLTLRLLIFWITIDIYQMLDLWSWLSFLLFFSPYYPLTLSYFLYMFLRHVVFEIFLTRYLFIDFLEHLSSLLI